MIFKKLHIYTDLVTAIGLVLSCFYPDYFSSLYLEVGNLHRISAYVFCTLALKYVAPKLHKRILGFKFLSTIKALSIRMKN